MGAHSTLRVVEREARVYSHMWRGLAFSTFVAPVLMLVALGVGLGDLVDENTGTVDGVDYLAFVAPGLLIAGAAQIAAGQSMWPVLGGMKWMRFYHGMMASPLEPRHIYAGHIVWNALRAVLSSVSFLVVGALLGAIPSWWGVLAIPVAALTAAAIAAPTAAWAAAQESDVPFPTVFRLVIMPLYLFSGAFFPIEQLPRWLEVVAVASPLYHGVELARAATTGDFGISILANVGVLAAYIAVGSVIGVRVFSKKLAA